MRLAHAPRCLHRWLWFAALYVTGVVTLGVVAYGVRVLLNMLR